MRKKEKQVLEITNELLGTMDNWTKKTDGDIDNAVVIGGIVGFFISSFAMLGFDEDLLLETLNKDFKNKVRDIREILEKNKK